MEAVQKSNERGVRFSKRLIAEAEQGQQEFARLRERLTGQARNGRGWYQETVDLVRRAADHSAELAEEFVAAAAEAGDELRDTVTAIIHANQQATQAFFAAIGGDAAHPSRKPAPRRTNRKRKATATRAAIERTVEQAAAVGNHHNDR